MKSLVGLMIFLFDFCFCQLQSLLISCVITQTLLVMTPNNGETLFLVLVVASLFLMILSIVPFSFPRMQIPLV